METYENQIVDEEQETNNVEVIDADETCEQDEAEVCESGLDGLSFALGAVATLLLVKGVKKVASSAPVQNGIAAVKTKIEDQKQRRAAAKEAKKLKLVEKTGESDAEVHEVGVTPAKAVNDK